MLKLLAIVVCTATVSLNVAPGNGQCSQIDTSWTIYVLDPVPREFEGESTLGSCHRGSKATCFRPARLADGSHGSPTLNASAVQAWSQDAYTVCASFGTVGSNRSVTGINLYFYHIPSHGIGLPNDIRITRSDVTSQALIEGNQDMSQDDNQLRNVTLVPQSLPSSGILVNIEFIFASFRDRVDWLLLTEVEICTSSEAQALPVPPPITFTKDTVSSVSPSTINSSITLTCSVTEGRFDWSWKGPPGISLPLSIVFNVGRTSVLELSQLSAGHSGTYRCEATHRYGQEPRASASFDISTQLQGTLQEESSVVHVKSSDSTATLRCTLYGYLPSGQEPSIEWRLNGSALSNSSVYAITTENGDMLIQNGGLQPIPSLNSTLTVNLTLSPVTDTQMFNCFSSQVSAPDFQNISIVQDTLTTKPGPVETAPPLPRATILSTPPVNDNLGLTLGLTIGLSVLALLVTIVFIISIIICVKQKRRKRLEIINVLPIPTLPSRSPGICPSSISVEAMGTINRSPILRTDFELSENSAYEPKPEMTGNEVEDKETAIYEDIDEVIPQYLESIFNPPLYPLQEQACRCEESAVNMGSSSQEIGMNENEAYEPKPGNETTDYDIIPVCEDEAEVNPVFAVRNHTSQSTTHKKTIPNHSLSQEV